MLLAIEAECIQTQYTALKSFLFSDIEATLNGGREKREEKQWLELEEDDAPEQYFSDAQSDVTWHNRSP